MLYENATVWELMSKSIKQMKTYFYCGCIPCESDENSDSCWRNKYEFRKTIN